MHLFAASVFLKALGWALADSIWLFAICWLLYRLFIISFRNLAAPAKHTMALCLLFSGSVFFIAELFWKYYANPTGIGLLPAGILVVENTSWYNNWLAAGNYMDALMPYWSLLYLACVSLLFIKLCFFVRRAGSLQNNGITKMGAAWRAYVKNISAQLGIQKEVNAFLSIHIDTPQVIGFLKPVILIPAACLVNLSTDQLEAVILHELVHIKRNDYLVNLFVASIEILFFFNPFVKQMTASIRKEREYSCDDMVIQFQYHPADYASALLTLEKNRLVPVTYGIAASGKNQKQLLTRIERIVGIKNKQPGFYQAGAGLIVLLLLGFIAAIHPAKTTDSRDTAILFTGNNISGQLSNGEAANHFINAKIIAAADGGNAYKTAKENVPSILAKTTDADNLSENENLLSATHPEEEYGAEENNAVTISNHETIDFSLPQKKVIDVPETPDPVAATVEPYVPASSFSYQLTQDTTTPKIKGETYNESMAREALIKTQKALTLLNWQKIEKELKYNKQDLVKLKKVLTLQLQNLDWQKINIDVQNDLSQEEYEKLQESIKKGHIIKQYQQVEAYNEALRKQLTEQEQLIKTSGQRIQVSQKAAENQQKKLQVEMKKRRIIYI
jgi:beta-lactamase regulating signal transducer with metallopeptidase domain